VRVRNGKRLSRNTKVVEERLDNPFWLVGPKINQKDRPRYKTASSWPYPENELWTLRRNTDG